MLKHPHRPGQADDSMTANIWRCCDRPAEDHPAWVDGEEVRIRLRYDVTTPVVIDGRVVSRTYRKGSIVRATRESYETLHVTGRGTHSNVLMPGYGWPTGERMSVGIPWHHATEVRA